MMRKIKILQLFVTLVLMLYLATTSTNASDQPFGAVPGKFVVKLAPRTNVNSISRSLGDGQLLQRPSRLIVRDDLNGKEIWDRIFVIQTDDPSISADDLVTVIGAGNIEFIEPDYFLEFFDFPQDALYSNQWYLHNTGQEYIAVERVDGDYNDYQTNKQGTTGNDIGIAYYYEYPPAVSTRIVVAIVDSGVDLVHPELQGKFWKNPDEIPDNGLDDDHNGLVDDTLGYDVSGDTLSLYSSVGDNDPTDSVGHGTHLAGIVAARADAEGIIGVAPQVEIMAVKIRPNATSAVGAAGIIYAVNAGAQVINISWGTPFESRLLWEAIMLARANGVFVSISAGNTGGNHAMYPAAFEDAFTIAASNSDGFLAEFTTWGPHIDLVAPGQDILSLRAAGTDMYASTFEPNVHIVGDNSLYYLADGTSMSSPLVAGAAAMMLSVRPDLTLNSLETLLRLGATDLVDPFNIGDNLPGPDTISGYGSLNIENSLLLAINGGIYFVEPIRQNRYTGPVDIKIASIGGYEGGWTMAYSVNTNPDDWIELANGSSLPTDSLACTLQDPVAAGHITLRLSDDLGVERFLSFVLADRRAIYLTSPESNGEYNYTIPIIGSVHGPEYDSAHLSYREGSGPQYLLHRTTGEYFDSLIYQWDASGVELGRYSLYLYGYFDNDTVIDSVAFDITSAFAEGWPQPLSGRGAFTAICADLNNDELKEIIVGTNYGLNVFHANGQLVNGFPALVEIDTRSIPAVYDIDRDGENEIICTSDSGIHVLNYDGTDVPGWPVRCITGRVNAGHPSPTITRLGAFEDSAIVIINTQGQVLAYKFNGEPYFYSLDGWFASISQIPTGSSYLGGNSVAGTDLDGDGRSEIVVTFSAPSPKGGVGIFEGRTGQPAFYLPEPQVVYADFLYGSVMADLDRDGLPEIITNGYDSIGMRTIWIKTDGLYDYPGWPIQLPAVDGWLGKYPTVADLDLDGVPEILCVFTEFDIGVLYVFRADGTPYKLVEGRPFGEAYLHSSVLSAPIVANLTGDEYPEVVLRSGYLFPGTGTEKVHILDHTITSLPGWPISTPAPPFQIFSTPYTPMVDDIDGDDLVELVLVSEALTVYVWDFDAPSDSGRNRGRMFMDNTNSSMWVGAYNPTDVQDNTTLPLPRVFYLYANYPNPFNPTTTIAFEIPVRSDVKLDVFNILGQRVSTLVDRELPGGHYSVEFDGSDYASGVYLCRLKSGKSVASQKMVLLK